MRFVTSPNRPRKRSLSAGQTIGGILAGFDAQVFRAGKPPAELVREAEPVRGLTGQDGSLLSIEFPDAAPPGGADRDATADAGAGPVRPRGGRHGPIDV